MSADGEQIDEANMIGDEYLCGERVDAAFAAIVGPDLVCVDTGCNKIILMDVPEDQNNLTTYRPQQDRYLVTSFLWKQVMIIYSTRLTLLKPI